MARLGETGRDGTGRGTAKRVSVAAVAHSNWTVASSRLARPLGSIAHAISFGRRRLLYASLKAALTLDGQKRTKPLPGAMRRDSRVSCFESPLTPRLSSPLLSSSLLPSARCSILDVATNFESIAFQDLKERTEEEERREYSRRRDGTDGKN